MARRFPLRLAILLLLPLLPSESRVAIAAPGPSTPAPLIIEAVTHNAQGLLSAGDRITVTLRGSGGGAATFHIFGLAVDSEMREIRSGGYPSLTTLYVGTYEVRPGDSARNASVFGTLALRGNEVIAVSPRLVNVDARLPVITSRHPKPDSRLPNLRPNIAIELVDLDTGINPAMIRLLVNGRNVTAKASISETSVVYNPETPFQPGVVRVQLSVADRAGNVLQNEWTFHIAPPGNFITSVTINPASPLTRDDLLTVVMTGDPGGRATFTIKGIRGVVPMKESSTPGIYFGTLPVRRDHSVVDGELVVTLEKNGRTVNAPASALVTILGMPPQAPRITTRALASENPLGGPISVGGSSGPGYRILGRVTYEGSSPNLEGTMGEFVALAGPDGRWQISLGPVIPLERSRVLLTVIAIDPAGQRSPPMTIELTS